MFGPHGWIIRGQVRWLAFLSVAGLLGLFVAVPRAEAVEYRLLVVNMWDSGFNAFAKPGELADGASGPGLEELMASLDRGDVPRGPLLPDRTFRWASETVVRAYGAVRVLAEIKPGGEGQPRWDEVRWDGKPGERSVWVVEPSGRGRPQQLYHVILSATGPARHFLPYAPTNGQRLVTVRYPLEFLWFHEERGDLWERHLSKSVDLSNGIAVVAGANSNSLFPDVARLLVNHAEQPMTYKAVLIWRQAPADFEAPRIPRTR
jgi:hypothetical protein